ncbi:hypothetical protein WDZ92_54350, partial [Nostoc sp. NIES-2111]
LVAGAKEKARTPPNQRYPGPHQACLQREPARAAGSRLIDQTEKYISNLRLEARQGRKINDFNYIDVGWRQIEHFETDQHPDQLPDSRDPNRRSANRRKPNRPLSNMALEMTLRRMKLDVTAHGFRSTFKDWAMEKTAHPGELSEMALAHAVRDKTEAAYRRGDLLAKRRALMQDWDAFCASGEG